LHSDPIRLDLPAMIGGSFVGYENKIPCGQPFFFQR
jgi:hypothetical protein